MTRCWYDTAGIDLVDVDVARRLRGLLAFARLPAAGEDPELADDELVPRV